MQTRRMIVLVVILMGLTALVATIAPRQARENGSARATPSPAAAPVTTASTTEEPDVSAVLDADSERRRTIRAELGDSVAIVVEGSQVDSVALGDLDVQDLEPGVPARFELLADTPGSYPLVLVNANRRIATLQVR